MSSSITEIEKLTKNELHTLKLVYKFRFVTSSLIAEYKGLNSKRSVNLTLSQLQRKGLLVRKFESSYKLIHRSAEYYLSPRGLRLLRYTAKDLNRRALSVMLRNNLRGENFIKKQLLVFKIYLVLRVVIKGSPEIYTQMEMVGLDHLPKPSPDLYYRAPKNSSESTSDFFLSTLSDVEPFVVKKIVRAYLNHFRSEQWQKEEARNYPTILICCQDESLKKRAMKLSNSLLMDAYFEGLTILFATIADLLDRTDNSTSTIWCSASHPDQTISLPNTSFL